MIVKKDFIARHDAAGLGFSPSTYGQLDMRWHVTQDLQVTCLEMQMSSPCF